MTPLVSAHRAETDVEAAIASGAHYLEFDVRAGAGGELVAAHDPLDGAGAPRVADLIAATRGRIKLHVDLKERGTEEPVIALLLGALAPEDFVLTTLEDDVVATIKARHPEVSVGLSLGRGTPERWLATRSSELFPFRRQIACGADFLAVHRQIARAGVLARATRRGVPVWVWTVNDPREIAIAMRDRRISTVITDHPHTALDTVAAQTRG